MPATLRLPTLLLLGLVMAATATAHPAAAQDPGFAEREAANYARTSQAPTQQAADPAFLERWQLQSLANFQSYAERQVADPAWVSDGNLCKEWAEQCTGDPFRYPGVDDFYDRAQVEPVSFLDRGGARLSGRVWAPRGATGRLPGVVIINGSVQAPETLYWWAAQALVDAGYVVMTFDPRGQGRSDNRTPDGEQGSNANPDVFATNLIDAIDFFHSTPAAPYEGNVEGDPREVTAANPLHALVDRERLGAVGHSLGANGVSVVQGAQPWPGTGDANPIDVIVAWDNLALSAGTGEAGLAGIPLVPRVPAMGQSGDYFLTPTPYTAPPDPDDKRGGYLQWTEAGLPSYQLVIEGGTHYEWSLLPTFPTTAWEPGGDGGWGNPLARHFTTAWLDRWLKAPGEVGFGDADARLLDLQHRPAEDDLQGDETTASWCERLSFHFTSSHSFPGRDGQPHAVDDLGAGCGALVAAPASPSPSPTPTPPPAPGPSGALPATGGLPAVAALLALATGLLIARRRRAVR